MSDVANSLLSFFHLCEALKIEKRHGKTSDHEPDRVASHCWRMAIMAMFLAPFLEKKIDLEKALKIALIHDLPEVITGDQAYFKHMFDLEAKQIKEHKENEAIKQIAAMLPAVNSHELLSLWQEYEAQSTYEARFIKAIDKIEAQIQHNEADISVWNQYDIAHYKTYLNQFCDFDVVLKQLRELIQEESSKKLGAVV